MLTRGLRWCVCLLSLSLAGSFSPAQAQSSPKLPLAHLAPEECVFFATWSGPAVGDAKSANRTEQLLAEESVRDFFQQFGAEAERVADLVFVKPHHTAIVGKILPLLMKTALTHPGAIFLTRFTPGDRPEFEAAIVLDAETDGPRTIETLKKFIAILPQEGPNDAPDVNKICFCVRLSY